MALNVVSQTSIARVLIVDDDVSVRSSMVRLLTARGFRVEAAGPAEALRVASKIVPDVILLDLHMPGVGGVEVARRIKASAKLAHIPLIAISATMPSPDPVLPMFDLFLAKPCAAAQLLAAIESMLSRNLPGGYEGRKADDTGRGSGA
jgi:CheY-like chemotaxis protein